MSQHYFSTTYQDRPITVLAGWDRPLSQHFMVIEHDDADDDTSDKDIYLYSNLHDSKAWGQDWSYFQRKLDWTNTVERLTIMSNIVLAMGTRPQGATSLSSLVKPRCSEGLVSFYLGLPTESVDMSVLIFPSFPPRSNTTAVGAARVFSVAQRFTERHCPRNSLVQHVVHGRGTVAACDGHLRHVDFEVQVTKHVSELSEAEWPEDVEPGTLVSVSWIDLTRQVVSVAELRELERVATDKYQRWGS